MKPVRILYIFSDSAFPSVEFVPIVVIRAILEFVVLGQLLATGVSDSVLVELLDIRYQRLPGNDCVQNASSAFFALEGIHGQDHNGLLDTLFPLRMLQHRLIDQSKLTLVVTENLEHLLSTSSLALRTKTPNAIPQHHSSKPLPYHLWLWSPTKPGLPTW